MAAGSLQRGVEERAPEAGGERTLPRAGAPRLQDSGEEESTVALAGRQAAPPKGSAGPGPEVPGLLLVSAPDAARIGSFHLLGPGGLTIGRAEGAGICIDDPGVSRRHVELVRGGAGEVVAVDLGSTNGTFVNGVGIHTAVLSQGDRLQIGTSTEFLFGVRREVAQAEIRLRQAISASGAGTWEWLIGSDGLSIYGGVARLLGLASDATGPTARDAWRFVHPEDRERLRAALAGSARSCSSLALEVRLLAQGGAVIWVDLAGGVFRDGDAHPVRLAGTLLDVTERHRADAELRRQSLLFDNLSGAVVVVGADDTIIDWSAGASRLLGWSKSEALGRRPGALLLGEGGKKLDEALVAVARSGGRCSEELTLGSKAGQEIPVEMVAFPLVNEGQQIMGCVAIFRDLCEQKRLEARLRASEQLASLGTLAAGVAHEINNPLSFVIANLDYVVRELSAARALLGPQFEDLQQALGDSHDGAMRIARIVSDLQRFTGRTRGEAGASDPNRSLQFALKAVAARMQKRATLVTDINPVPPVVGGADRLGQVFLNLLVNAIQAIEPGQAAEKFIRVSSRFDLAARRVVFEVQDDGAGIPADVLPRIFEPFFTTKPVGVGTGLGLFICHGIITDLEGELTVESRPGKGTTFRVSLPAASSGDLVRARPRVLFVDPKPLIGQSLRRLLGGRYELVPVASPLEALARVRSGEPFSAVVFELQMAELPGAEFLLRLREEAPQLASRAIAIGGAPGEPLSPVPEPLRPQLLHKPIDVARLDQLLGDALDG